MRLASYSLSGSPASVNELINHHNLVLHTSITMDGNVSTQELIARLLLSDYEEVLQASHNHGLAEDDERQTQQLVWAGHAEYLRSVLTHDQDHRMALSMGNAVRTDNQIVAAHQQEEERTTADRELARRLQAGTPEPVPLALPAPTDTNAIDDSQALVPFHDHPCAEANDGRDAENLTLERALVLYTGRDMEREDNSHDTGSSNSELPLTLRTEDHSGDSLATTTSYENTEPLKYVQCVACEVDILEPYAIITACEPEPHAFCHICIKHVFDNAINDISYYPPRCCRKPINIEDVRALFDEAFLATLTQKAEMYDTPDGIYCSSVSCGAFVHPRHIVSNLATCPKCSAETCGTCKQAAHGTDDCPEDSNLQALLKLAEEQGWTRCSRCHAIVELTMGCNHMT